jgi:hypothetical protein
MNPSPSRHAAAFTVILLALGFLAGCAPAHIGTTVSASVADTVVPLWSAAPASSRIARRAWS